MSGEIKNTNKPDSLFRPRGTRLKSKKKLCKPPNNKQESFTPVFIILLNNSLLFYESIGIYIICVGVYFKNLVQKLNIH